MAFQNQSTDENVWTKETAGKRTMGKSHQEQFIMHILHQTPRTIRVINASRMRWEGHVARMI